MNWHLLNDNLKVKWINMRIKWIIFLKARCNRHMSQEHKNEDTKHFLSTVSMDWSCSVSNSFREMYQMLLPRKDYSYTYAPLSGLLL